MTMKTKMKMKMKGRVIFVFSLLFMMTIVLLNFNMSVRFLRFSRLLVEEKLASNVISLNFHLEENRRNTRIAAVSLSQNQGVIDAVINRDGSNLIETLTATFDLFRVNYYTVTDHEGIVIARTHEPWRYGDSVAHQQNIQDALNGIVSTHYEEGTAVAVSIRTGAPIYDEEGFIIGVVSAGVRFDTDDTVDDLSGLLNTEVSVFLRDRRVSTTLTQNGMRAHGTYIEEDIAQVVIAEKTEYTGAVNLFGQYYETYYKPLINANDETFAIIVLGINVDDLKRESNALFFEAILIGLMGIIIAIILLYFLREAMEANAAKSVFLSTMSHEIRTPMNAIIGITEIQLQNKKIDEDVREALGRIYNSGDMLLGIINDILDLSKIEAGRLELSVSDYETASLISDTSQLNMMRIGSKPIEFELFVDENIPSVVSGDELRVKQILNNLLSNAFKYTQEGKVTLSVGMEHSNEKSKKVTFIFKVSDTGQGMTKEQIRKLFDDYTRFNTAVNRKTEGTGLGMGITRNLIRMMDGSISVKSEPGKGTEFTVRIQQEKAGDGVLGREMAENLLKFRTESRAKMKRTQVSHEPMPYGSVLIVDDAEMNIYVAKGLLTPYKLKIDDAGSGFEAIEKIKSGNTYDIIFMDHMMPEMDGIETVKKIREMGYDQPIVALTANAISGQSEIFLENGFDDYISKPIDIRQMNSVLNKYIRDRKPTELVQAAREAESEKQNTRQKI